MNTELAASGDWFSKVLELVLLINQRPENDFASKARAQLVSRMTGSRNLPKLAAGVVAR